MVELQRWRFCDQLCLQMHIHTFEVTEVTYGQPQQLGCEDIEDLEENDDLLNGLISNKAVCRTALV